MDLFQKKPIDKIISLKYIELRGTFLKRVGLLLEEGYSLKEALEFIKRIEKDDLYEWILAIQKGLEQGNLFHIELRKIGFSEKICSQIYLGSKGTSYAETITNCGDQLLVELKQKKKLYSLLLYPVILFSFLIGMLLTMRFIILPHMEILFTSTNETNDIYSNGWVLMIYYFPQIFLMILFSLCIYFLYLRNKLSKMSIIESISYFIQFPFIDLYLKDYWSIFLFNEWGVLLKNGCSFKEIIKIMLGEESSKLMKEVGECLSNEMEKGKPIHEAVKILPFFYNEGYLIIAHGENTGRLGTEMVVYAQHCEYELTNRIEKLMIKIQPIVFCFVALMIIGIYAALMLPMFTLMEGL